MAEVGGTSNSLTCLLVFGQTIWEVDLEQYPDRTLPRRRVDGDRVISEMDCQNIPLDSLKLQEVRHFIFVCNETGSTYLQDNFDPEHKSDDV